METLKNNLNDLTIEIQNLEVEIEKERLAAEDNIKPLKDELTQLKIDKRNYASKNDFDSVQNCRRRENNLKFRIDAQWNRYSILKENLLKLNAEKKNLEAKIKLEEDKIRRDRQIRTQMDLVLKNYKKSQSLKKAAIDSNISPDSVQQWHEWGKNQLSETYVYFYDGVSKIDEYFRDLKAQELKGQMDSVIEAYRKTKSLRNASKIAGVSYDTVQYWFEWGSKGFGQENAYFFKKINEI